MPRVHIYASGHGFGHAVRMAEVARSVLSLGSEWSVIVGSASPEQFPRWVPGLQAEVAAGRLQSYFSRLDVGVVETANALEVDKEKTTDAIRTLYRHSNDMVSREVERICDSQVTMILSDIPFLAGIVGARVGVPVVAVGNFTWDWIYEPLLYSAPDRDEILSWARSGYAQMHAWCRLPFGHDNDLFAKTLDVPLVVRRSMRSRDEVMGDIGVQNEKRPIALCAMRIGLTDQLVAEIGRRNPDIVFLCLAPISADCPENIIVVPNRVAFSEAVMASDVVISKLGYGILAETAAAQKALLWPPRSGFREDTLLIDNARKLVRQTMIPLDAYLEGEWRTYLEALVRMPIVGTSVRTDGGATIAKMIAEWALA